MIEYRIKRVCPACGTTNISNSRIRKQKCYMCKAVFETPILKEVRSVGGLKLREKRKTEIQTKS